MAAWGVVNVITKWIVQWHSLILLEWGRGERDFVWEMEVEAGGRGWCYYGYVWMYAGCLRVLYERCTVCLLDLIETINSIIEIGW